MDSTARHQFLQAYARIRHAEGRGSEEPAYYHALPDRDLTGTNCAQWRIRARSYHHFADTVLAEMERQSGRPLDIVDLGAGNGWLSYRLSQRRHRVVALDIFPDARDGLGALTHYAMRLQGVLAEFDHLPFREASFDLAIYNSSFHYSSDYRRTLAEARRCLRASGRVVIVDSPLYRRAEHGERMRAERQASFEAVYGFRSEALRSIEFLDENMLAELARELDIEWRFSQPWYGWNWALRPWKARLRGGRPPSRFGVLLGRFRGQ
jgi:SAM-dependent methyltransferase